MTSNLTKYIKENKFEILFLTFVIIIAFAMRLIGVLNHGDLWTDELFSLYYAEQDNVFELIKTMYNEDLHAPLYQIILHFYLKFFNQSIFAMRFSSIILSVLFFPALFYVTKHLFSRQCAIFAVLFALLNTFLLHHSLELRPYAILPLFGLLACFAFVKYLEKLDVKSSLTFILFDLLLLYTFNISFIFVFFQFVIGIIYLLYYQKKYIKHFILSFLILGILYIPCAVIIIHGIYLYRNSTAPLTSAMFQFYPSFLYRLQEVFYSSVYVQMRNNAPFNFSNLLEPICYFSSFFPVFLSLIFVIKAFFSKNIRFYLFLLPPLLYLASVLCLAFSNHLILLRRYVIFVYPAFLIALCYGLSLIQVKKVKMLIFSILIFINFTTLFILSGMSVLFLHFEDTAGVIKPITKQENIKKTDFVLFPFFDNLYKRFVEDANVVEFSANKLFFPQDREIMELFFGSEVVSKLNQDNARELLKPFFSRKNPTADLENYFKDKIFSKMKTGDRLFVIVDSAGLIESYLVVSSDVNTPEFMDANLAMMIYVKAEKDILSVCEKYLRPVKIVIAKRKISHFTRIQVYEKTSATP